MVCHHVSIKLVENEGISCEKAISSKNNMCGKTISGYYLYIYMRKSNNSSRLGLVKTIVTMVPWISMSRVSDLGVSHLCSRCPWRFSTGATITASCVGHWYICWLQSYHRCHFWPTWIQKLRLWCHSVRFLKPEMTSSWVTEDGCENASLSCKWQSKPCTPSECHASWFPPMNPDEAARNFHWSGTQLLGKT